MATDKKFSLTRVKHLLEFNLRKCRVRGFEYDPMPGSDPSGNTGLVTEDKLTAWDNNKAKITIQANPIMYALSDNNNNLRDAIAQTVFDLFNGNSMDDSKTISGSLSANYITTPIKGSDVDDGTGYYVEVDPAKTIKMKNGNNTIEINNTETKISNGSNSMKIDGSEISLTFGTNNITVNATGVFINGLPFGI